MASEKLKNDKFKNRRGGNSRLLDISCVNCGSHICLYQKDGPGNLRRMYLDRISAEKVTLTDKTLVCPKGHLLAIKTIYKKENRPAYRLLPDAVVKKIIKS